MGATFQKTGKKSWRVAIYRNGERAYTGGIARCSGVAASRTKSPPGPL